MELTITKVGEMSWYAGMLQNVFSGDGWTSQCNSPLYRNGMQSTSFAVKGIGSRGFALASMPVDWTPRVGDVINVHPSQL